MAGNEVRVHEICDALSSELVFHLSLHSKELFHSNVLAWFCEMYPSAARDVFGGWVSARDTSRHLVQREHKNIDLIVELPGLAPMVMENKVFAPIDESQLTNYSDDKELNHLDEPEYFCLSLGSPSWEETGFVSASGVTWKYISYRALAQRIFEVVDGVPGFDGDLLRRYVRFVELLQGLSDELGTPGALDSIELDEQARSSLQRIRMHDAVGKLRVRSALASLSRSMKEVDPDNEVVLHANFTNGRPLLEAFIPCGNGDQIGWQYQNDQFRLAIKTGQFEGKSELLKLSRHAYVFDNYVDWFDFGDLPDLVRRADGTVPSKESKGGFNDFSPNFVYRYRKIKEPTVAEIQVLSHHYIARARKLRESVN